MRNIICLLALFAIAAIAQTDVDYHINCPGEKRNMDTFDEAVARAKEEKFDHTHFYICGIVNITTSQDITFRVKMFGFVQGTAKRQIKSLPAYNITSTDDLKADPYQNEAIEKRKKMWALVDSVDVGTLAQLWVAPGVRLDFKGLTQIHNLQIIMAEGQTGGFKINFYHQTGIYKSIIGGSLYETPLDIISTGHEFKCYDSVVGVSKFSIADKTTTFTRCAWFLAPGSGRNAFNFQGLETGEIGTSFFAGKDTAGHNAEVIMTNIKGLTIKNNCWFDSAIKFQGPVKTLSTSAEFGYSFGAPPAQ